VLGLRYNISEGQEWWDPFMTNHRKGERNVVRIPDTQTARQISIFAAQTLSSDSEKLLKGLDGAFYNWFFRSSHRYRVCRHFASPSG
jgi:hypothetical protein